MSNDEDSGVVETTFTESFGANFERAVVSVIINVPDFANIALALLAPEYFEDDAHALIVEHAQAIYAASNKVPSSVGVLGALHEAAGGAKGAAQLNLRRAIEVCESDMTLTPADVAFIQSKVGTFVQRSATRAALLKAIELHEKGKDDDAVTMLIKSRDKISAALTSASNDGIELFDTVSKIRSYQQRNKQSSNCPYGVPKLDGIMRGGLERGCLGMFMGPPGRGKTRALVSGGANALAHGCVVVHVTLELGKEDVAMRYDARLTGIPINDIKARPKHYAKTIHGATQALQSFGGALFIQQWAPGEATLLDVISYLHRVADKVGKPVDTLMLDYIDLLKPTKGDERWEQHGQMAVGAKRLAVTENLRLWSASQTKTESFSRRNIQLSDVSDTVEKVRISDVIIGLGQTDAEKRMGKMRLIVLKNRLGGNEGKIIDCLVNDETQSVAEDHVHQDMRDVEEECF